MLYCILCEFACVSCVKLFTKRMKRVTESEKQIRARNESIVRFYSAVCYSLYVSTRLPTKLQVERRRRNGQVIIVAMNCMAVAYALVALFVETVFVHYCYTIVTIVQSHTQPVATTSFALVPASWWFICHAKENTNGKNEKRSTPHHHHQSVSSFVPAIFRFNIQMDRKHRKCIYFAFRFALVSWLMKE